MTATWKTKPLRDLADIRVSNVDKKTLPSERPVHLCNYMDVYANEYVTADHSFMAATATRNEIQKFGLRLGDVMITKDSESPDDIGVPSVIVDEIDNLVCGYHLALMRPKLNEICPVYLAKQLAAAEAKRYFGINASGSTRFGIPIGAIESFELPLPELPEQSKIAEVLSTVDRAIAQTEALIAKQQRIKTGLMQDLLTRGIDQHGNLRSEATHAFKDSPLGRIPVEWGVRSLGVALGEARGFLQTGPFGSQLHAHEYTHTGIPVIMPQDILHGRVSTAIIARIPKKRANDLRRHCVVENDIIFSRRGDLTRAAAIRPRETGWLCGTGCFLLRVSSGKMSAKWLAHLYRHHWIQRQIETNSVGSTMPSLNNGVMSQLVAPFPNVDEQHVIADRADAMGTEIESLKKRRKKLRSLKTGLMQDLLTGKVRVTPLLEQAKEATA
ncbi:MAG: restriction endonuclease subunit S [Nitrococcus sp.]|nr:restriction endonuclease subunit S [Nitrococcus sp.]